MNKIDKSNNARMWDTVLENAFIQLHPVSGMVAAKVQTQLS